MCVPITGQRHGRDRFMINHVGNLLQRNNDQVSCVLVDDQIIHAGQLGHFGTIRGMLDRSRCLLE